MITIWVKSILNSSKLFIRPFYIHSRLALVWTLYNYFLLLSHTVKILWGLDLFNGRLFFIQHCHCKLLDRGKFRFVEKYAKLLHDVDPENLMIWALQKHLIEAITASTARLAKRTSNAHRYNNDDCFLDWSKRVSGKYSLTF